MPKYTLLGIEPEDIKINQPPSDSSNTTRMELEELEAIIQEAKLPRALMRVADRDPLRIFFSLAKKKGIDPYETQVKELAKQLTNLSFDLKNRYKRRRPWEVKREHDVDFVVDKTDTSDSSSYPSGHALMGYGVAEFYKDKYPLMANEWENLADIIAHQRMQSGVHYPSDIEASKKVVEQLYSNRDKTANISLNTILKATEEGLSKMNLKGLADKVDLYRARRNLGKAVKDLHKYQDATGRFGQMPRIVIPKSHLDIKDLKRLGFQDSLVAVPEVGQKTWTTYRHPLDKLHLHDHGDLLNMHIDSLPSLQMVAERNRLSRKAYDKLLETIPEGIKPWKRGKGPDKPILKKLDAQVSGIGHTILEGGPGYLNYGLKQLNPFKVGMADEILSKLPKDYLKKTYGYTRKVAEVTKTAEEQPLLRHRSTLLIRDPETNKLLAAKEPPNSKASPFYFPGGGLYDDEYSTPRNPTEEEIIEGARREALEELGMELNNPRVVGSFGQELEGWWKDKALKKRGVPYLGGHEHYILADKGKEDRSLYNVEGDAFEQGDYYDPQEIVEALSRAAKSDSAFAPFNREQVRVIKDNLLKKNASDLSVLTAVPKQNLDLIMRKGLYSQKAMLDDPEVMAAFLAQRNADKAWKNDEQYDEKRFREQYDKRRKLIEDKGGSMESLEGPSVFFTEPDPDKVSDPRHFINKFNTETLRVNLAKLLKDIPDTRIHGAELTPWNEKDHEADPDNYYKQVHRDITPEEVSELIARGSKDLWKHYSDESLGRYYAKDVPHAFIRTPSGIIPPEYLEKVEKTSAYKDYRPRGTLYLLDGKGGVMADKPTESYGSIAPYHFPGGGIFEEEKVDRLPTKQEVTEGIEREALEELGTKLKNVRVLQDQPVNIDMPDWWRERQRKKRGLDYKGIAEFYAAAERGDLDKSIYGADNDEFKGTYYPIEEVAKAIEDSVKPGDEHYDVSTGQARLLRSLLEKTSEAKPDLNKFIKYIEEEARNRGVKDMHVVMSHPDHPLGGGSAHYTTDLDKDSKSALLVKALRSKMREWEQQQGLDPDHDWDKTAASTRGGFLTSGDMTPPTEADPNYAHLLPDKPKRKRKDLEEAVLRVKEEIAKASPEDIEYSKLVASGLPMEEIIARELIDPYTSRDNWKLTPEEYKQFRYSVIKDKKKLYPVARPFALAERYGIDLGLPDEIAHEEARSIDAFRNFSYPSFHTARGAFLAETARDLVPEDKQHLVDELISRIGRTRIQQGVHSHQDVEAGELLGREAAKIYKEKGIKTSSAKEQLKHILVTGHSGAGKTTYARQLAEELGIPLHRLDVTTGPIMEAEYPKYWDDGTMGYPEDVSTRVIQQALDLDTPHVIEGSHILEIPELTEGYKRVLIDTPEDRVVEQRAQREYRNQGRKGKPYRPIEKHREAAKELVNHYRDIVTNFRNQPGVESIVPEVKTAQEQLKHILITGQSGSGKTTEAKRLAKELSMPVIHLDEQKGFGPKGVDPDYIEDLTEATQDIISKLDKPHIVEGTQMLSEQFPTELLKKHDLRIMEADEDELVRRLTERGWNTESGRDFKGPESADEARHVTKHQRKSVEKLLGKLKKKASLEDEFQPDLTPDDLKALGVYDQVYGDAPSEASMKEWPEHWINKQDPLGWLQWYERYSKGRRTEDDARQIKRWKSFKARHLAQYLKSPTIKRKAALRNWAIDVDKEET